MALVGGNWYAGTTYTTNSDLPMLPVERRLGGNATVEMKVGIREVIHCAMVRGSWYSSPGSAVCSCTHYTMSSLRHVQNVCDRVKSLQFIKYKSRL